MDLFGIFSSLVMIICSIFGIICAVIFILIVKTHRPCQTLNILLVLNSTIAGFIANVTCMCQSIYQLLEIGNDILCPFRGYMLQTGTGLLYHTLCVQTFYRLIVTVYSTRRSLQTKRFNIFMVITQWVISCIFALPYLLTNGFKYQSLSLICQVQMENAWGFSYFAVIIFFIPLITIILIYIHIVKYMKQNPYSTNNHSNVIAQHRQQSELRLIRRILMIVSVLFMLGFPYFFLFIAIEIDLIPPWPYLTRIGYIFITFGQSTAMLINLLTTDDVKKVLKNIIMKYIIQRNRIHSINLINVPNLPPIERNN